METRQLKHVIEAALLAAGRPLDMNELRALFGESDPPSRDDLRGALAALEEDYRERGIVLHEVAGGFRIQVRNSMTPWLASLWDERAPRYSRALMETLAIIAYRQPVTRGDVEDIRGVGVTTNIMRTLLERNWIRVVGFRDVPGRPAMYGTTREFLDYFGLRKLDDLPPLAELKDLESLTAQLDLGEPIAAIAEEGTIEQQFDEDGDDLEETATVRASVIDIAAVRPGGDADAGDAPAPASNVVPLKGR